MAARERRGSWRRRAPLHALLVGVLLLAWVAPAAAELTPQGFLAKKRKAWGTMGQCQARENAKRLKGKEFDLARCRTTLDRRMSQLSQQARAEGIACRSEINGDGRVTDYDTSLQWDHRCVPGVYRNGLPSFAIPGGAGEPKRPLPRAWDGVGWCGAHHEGAF
jgi:hypothetical protein